MASQAVRHSVPPLPVWKGGFVSPFRGAGQRLREEAKEAVARRRRDRGERVTRSLTVEEALALRHDQTKRRQERKQRIEIALPDDLSNLPDSLVVKPDGSLAIKNLDSRSRVFSALYRDLLTRYELVLLLERDFYMNRADFVDFRTAVKRLPVPLADEPPREQVEALDRWYAEAPTRRAHKEALDAAQERRRFLGYKALQPSLPLEPFPPQAALFFKEAEPLSPIVHTALRDKFTAVARLPQFRHMEGLPYFAGRHSRSTGNTVLIGIPQFRQDTVASFLRVLKQYANKPPREFSPLPAPGRNQAPKLREAGKSKRLVMIAGMLRGRLLDSATLPELATLSTLDMLQAQIVGQIAAASGLNVVGALQQATSSGQQLLGVLNRAAGGDVLGKLEGYRRSLSSPEQIS